ncbi:signal recognition particle subunit SRP72, putative [Plasmodium vivax]|uniref:Uncharacterized protein n=2 Tax=Plasmodium vivax TaxID=5855 RepID=A0A0J9TV58_PLAVI|nr:hypothetical protein PVNG_05305 [Plasmodium vivax North Korean]CAG9477140.1 unnamed protein product [Plasmodium vivax]SCO67463.1 signal recognition particle subunit SRP72, putative [Plasmodium vivax]SCO72850.1 signal recognition particle subunit SRP72, putative [Plasmodium vivax]
MSDAQSNGEEVCTLDEIKSHFESKKYEEVLNLTKKIYSSEECDEYALRARYYCLIERGEFAKLVHEIMHMLVRGAAGGGSGEAAGSNNGKSSFKELFQGSYESIKRKNVLFELFYCMYKLKKLKKLNGCLKYMSEKEENAPHFLDVLLAEVNFRLHHFEASIGWYENLIESQNAKQAVAASINVNSGYFSLYFRLLYEYNFLRSVNSRVSSDKAKQKDIDEVKNQIVTNTDGFKFEEERDSFEQIFNYATFFIVEKNYTEAVKFLDLADAICRSSFTGGSASDSGAADGAEEVDHQGADHVDEEDDEGGEDAEEDENNRGDHSHRAKKRSSDHSARASLSREDVLTNKRTLVQLQRAYVYSKSNRLKDAIAIYENVLHSYAESGESAGGLIPLVAYNNYLALRHNCEGQSARHVKPRGKSAPGATPSGMPQSVMPPSGPLPSGQPPMFSLSQDKLNKIKSDLRMSKRGSHNDASQFMQSVALFNECVCSLRNDQKDEFKSKLSTFSTRFGNSILLDKLIALFLKSENAHIKCKHHLLKNIHLMYSHQNKIKFLNAYLFLCYEKKSFAEIVKMYWKYEYVFKMDVHHYRTFFSNLFYVYICARYGGESRPLMGKNSTPGTSPCTKGTDADGDSAVVPRNLPLVIDLFNKYKQAIKTDLKVVNYETVFLVSKYLLHHGKAELLTDLFDHLSKQVKNDFHFFSCFTYIYTYIDMELTYKYEDKLKKAVLTETYLIDVEDLESKNFALDFTSIGTTTATTPGGANIHGGSPSTGPIDRNKKKRKRSKKAKNKKDGAGTHAGYDPEKWLPKHEKTGFKKSKKKKQKTSEAPPKPKVVVVEEPKSAPAGSSKLQGLKKRRKK